MRRARWLPGLVAASIALVAGACAHSPPPPVPASPLPPLPVARPADRLPPVPAAAPADDPLAGIAPGPPVTLLARDVDVRALLMALAEGAGISLVLAPEVQGQVSVNLADVPTRDALRAVAEAAGLTLSTGQPARPVSPTVFYALPVSIESASVELIQARFGVTRATAEWIVAEREARRAGAGR